jgi:hypothetical protein
MQVPRSFDDHETLLQHGRLHSLNVGVNPAFKCGVLGCGQCFYDHEDLLQHGVSAHDKPELMSNPTMLPQNSVWHFILQNLPNLSSLRETSHTSAACPVVRSVLMTMGPC